MAEGEINIDNIIQRLLEGENSGVISAFQAHVEVNSFNFQKTFLPL